MDRALEVGMGDSDGFREALALGKLGGDGRRKGATAAMGVHMRSAAGLEDLGLASRPSEAVREVVALGMAALEQEGEIGRAHV